VTAPALADTLAVPGATLYLEVRGEGPLVVLFGTPMDAQSFVPLAELLAVDHTVLTTDPRGLGRSPVADPDETPSIERRAADVAALISHVDRGPATLLGSSGGATTALAVAQFHPDAVDTVIAHEPPLSELLPDRDALRAGREEVIRLWFAGDRLGSWRAFLANANIEMPEEMIRAIFGGGIDAAAQAAGDYQNAHLIRPSTEFLPDAARLRAGRPRVVIGIGEASAGQLCDRSSRALGDALGIEPTMFPGRHVGFAEDPAAFEPVLRRVLA
jgi:pimeloyl-ACP methyl ester carboxylesterase